MEDGIDDDEKKMISRWRGWQFMMVKEVIPLILTYMMCHGMSELVQQQIKVNNGFHDIKPLPCY
jgi:hypothetical protein